MDDLEPFLQAVGQSQTQPQAQQGGDIDSLLQAVSSPTQAPPPIRPPGTAADRQDAARDIGQLDARMQPRPAFRTLADVTRWVPFAPSIQTLVENVQRKSIEGRVAGGNATPEDFRNLEEMKSNEQAAAEHGPLRKAVDFTQDLISFGLEIYMTRGLSIGPRVSGAVLGRLAPKAAVGAAEVAPGLLSRVTAWTAGRGAEAAVRAGTSQLPRTLAGASEHAVHEGGEIYSPRNLALGYGEQVIGLAAAGGITRPAGGQVGNLGQLLVSSGIGVGEMRAGEILSGLYNEAFGNKSSYGVAGQLWRSATGQKNEWGEALGMMGLEMLGFTAMGRLHGYHNEVPNAFNDAVKSMVAKGYSEKQAVEYVVKMQTIVGEAAARGATRQEVFDAINNMPAALEQLNKSRGRTAPAVPPTPEVLAFGRTLVQSMPPGILPEAKPPEAATPQPAPPTPPGGQAPTGAAPTQPQATPAPAKPMLTLEEVAKAILERQTPSEPKVAADTKAVEDMIAGHSAPAAKPITDKFSPGGPLENIGGLAAKFGETVVHVIPSSDNPQVAFVTGLKGKNVAGSAPEIIKALKEAGFKDIQYRPDNEDGRAAARMRLFESLKQKFGEALAAPAKPPEVSSPQEAAAALALEKTRRSTLVEQPAVEPAERLRQLEVEAGVADRAKVEAKRVMLIAARESFMKGGPERLKAAKAAFAEATDKLKEIKTSMEAIRVELMKQPALTPREAVLGRLGNPPRPSDALPPAENKRPEGIDRGALRQQNLARLQAKTGLAQQELEKLMPGLRRVPQTSHGLGTVGERQPAQTLPPQKPPEAPPLRFKRIEEKGDAVGNPSKPHGLYVTPESERSIHEDLGGDRSTWTLPADAKVLTIKPYPASEVALRKDAIGAGTGVHAAKKLLGDAVFERLKNGSTADARKYAEEHYPGPDYSRYHDKQEIIEAIGAQEARRQGFDAIHLANENGKGVEETVLLSNRAVREAPAKPPVVGAKTPKQPAPLPPEQAQKAHKHVLQVIAEAATSTAPGSNLLESVNKLRKRKGFGELSPQHFQDAMAHLEDTGQIERNVLSKEEHAAIPEAIADVERRLKISRQELEGIKLTREQSFLLRQMEGGLAELKKAQQDGPGEYWTALDKAAKPINEAETSAALAEFYKAKGIEREIAARAQSGQGGTGAGELTPEPLPQARQPGAAAGAVVQGEAVPPGPVGPGSHPPVAGPGSGEPNAAGAAASAPVGPVEAAMQRAREGKATAEDMALLQKRQNDKLLADPGAIPDFLDRELKLEMARRPMPDSLTNQWKKEREQIQREVLAKHSDLVDAYNKAFPDKAYNVGAVEPPGEPHGPAMQPGQAQLLEHLRFKHGAGSMAEEFAGGGQSMMPAEPHGAGDWKVTVKDGSKTWTESFADKATAENYARNQRQSGREADVGEAKMERPKVGSKRTMGDILTESPGKAISALGTPGDPEGVYRWADLSPKELAKRVNALAKFGPERLNEELARWTVERDLRQGQVKSGDFGHKYLKEAQARMDAIQAALDRQPAGVVQPTPEESHARADAIRAAAAQGPTPLPGPAMLGLKGGGAGQNRTGAIDMAALGVKPEVVQAKFQEAWDQAKELAQQIYPRLTRANRAVGEAAARLISAVDYGKHASESFADYIVGSAKKIPEKTAMLWGATYNEMRLRQAKEVAEQREIDAHKAGDAAESKRWGDLARGMGTMIGAETKDGHIPLPNEKAFLDTVNSKEFHGMFERWLGKMVPKMEENYHRAQGLPDNEDIQSWSQIPGAPINMMAVDPHNPTSTAGFVGGGKGNLRAPKQKKFVFAEGFTGASEAYEMDLRKIIENTFAKGEYAAAQAEFYRTAVEGGVAAWGLPGRSPGEGFTHELPKVEPIKGTQTDEKGQASLWFKSEGTLDEARRALAPDKPMKALPLAKALTVGTLATNVEAVSHFANMLRSISTEGWSPINFYKNAKGMIFNDPATKAKLLELFRIGAAKSKGFESGSLWGSVEALPSWVRKTDPTSWAGKALDVASNVFRMTLKDAYSSLAARGLYPANNETELRNFINTALGQYNIKAQHWLVAKLRESMVGPFATAVTTATGKGIRDVAFYQPGAKATSATASLQIRMERFARVAAVYALANTINYVFTGNALGSDDTPIGAIYTGRDDKGNPTYFNLAGLLTSTPRGMKETGISSLVEGLRQGQRPGYIRDSILRDLVHTVLRPAEGPIFQFAEIAATGRNPVGRLVSADEHSTGSNIAAAFTQANPTVAAFAGHEAPGHERTTGQAFIGMAGPFNPTTIGRNAALSNYQDRFINLQHQRTAAHESGRQFANEREYQILLAFHQPMVELEHAIRGQAQTRQGLYAAANQPAANDVRRWRQAQLDLARRALEAIRK